MSFVDENTPRKEFYSPSSLSNKSSSFTEQPYHQVLEEERNFRTVKVLHCGHRSDNMW